MRWVEPVKSTHSLVFWHDLLVERLTDEAAPIMIRMQWRRLRMAGGFWQIPDELAPIPSAGMGQVRDGSGTQRPPEDRQFINRADEWTGGIASDCRTGGQPANFPNRILAAGRLKMPWHRAANLAPFF